MLLMMRWTGGAVDLQKAGGDSTATAPLQPQTHSALLRTPGGQPTLPSLDTSKTASRFGAAAEASWSFSWLPPRSFGCLSRAGLRRLSLLCSCPSLLSSRRRRSSRSSLPCRPPRSSSRRRSLSPHITCREIWVRNAVYVAAP